MGLSDEAGRRVGYGASPASLCPLVPEKETALKNTPPSNEIAHIHAQQKPASRDPSLREQQEKKGQT